MNSLTEAPNIGTTLALKLKSAGINNIQELKEIGSENAILKIATIENNGACLNMLYALEGAVQGIRWHNLNNERKLELKEFYHTFMKE